MKGLLTSLLPVPRFSSYVDQSLGEGTFFSWPRLALGSPLS